MRTIEFFCALILTVMATLLVASPAVASLNEMLDMSEKLDKLEKQDFQSAVDKANACTRARKFPCAEAELVKAEKSASSGQDNRTLLAARQNIANEKTQVAEEERLRAEEARRQAEERQRVAEAEAERRMQQEQEDSQPSVASQLLTFGSLFAQNYQANSAARFAENTARDQAREQQRNAMAAEAANNERLLKAARESKQPTGEQQQAAVNSRYMPREQRPSTTTQPASAQTARAPVVPTYSGAPCGETIRCTLGMKDQRWCDASIPPYGPPCEEGCEIRGWGAAYHDTSLPGNVSYVPTGKPCKEGCTVINTCGG